MLFQKKFSDPIFYQITTFDLTTPYLGVSAIQHSNQMPPKWPEIRTIHGKQKERFTHRRRGRPPRSPRRACAAPPRRRHLVLVLLAPGRASHLSPMTARAASGTLRWSRVLVKSNDANEDPAACAGCSLGWVSIWRGGTDVGVVGL